MVSNPSLSSLLFCQRVFLSPVVTVGFQLPLVYLAGFSSAPFLDDNQPLVVNRQEYKECICLELKVIWDQLHCDRMVASVLHTSCLPVLLLPTCGSRPYVYKMAATPPGLMPTFRPESRGE